MGRSWGVSIFPFFVGCGRSGTTLLRSIFNAHPEIAVPYEAHFVVTLGDPAPRARYELEDGFAVEAFVADLSAQFSFRQWRLPEADMRSALNDPSPHDYADAIRKVYSAYALHQGKRRYADKTAINVLSIAMLAEMFPEAHFVHVIRDGRDVALSWIGTGWDFGPQTVEEAALYWRYHIRRGRRIGRGIPTRYREVHYEALIADPEGTLRELCPFLSIDFEPDMLEYFRSAQTLLEAMPRPKQHTNLLLPLTPGLRDWRRDMVDSDVRLFDEIAGNLLAELGYENRSQM